MLVTVGIKSFSRDHIRYQVRMPGISFGPYQFFLKMSSDGPVCSVNNKGRVEYHQEFWILVAGTELDWIDTLHSEEDYKGDEDICNIVPLPGNISSNCIGMFGDIVGTVNKCKVCERRSLS